MIAPRPKDQASEVIAARGLAAPAAPGPDPFSAVPAGILPRYETWAPRYADCLLIAFTISFAFSPTDTLPLTRTAKMLMMAQAAISVVTLTGIAGAAVNILAGKG